MSMATSVGRFTLQGKRALDLARDEAIRLNHNYIGAEHLLLGLVHDNTSAAGMLLASSGIELEAARSAVENTIGRGELPVSGDIETTTRARGILKLAEAEAHRLGTDYVGSLHLLLALAREPGRVAYRVLEDFGIDLARLEGETIGALATSEPEPPSTED